GCTPASTRGCGRRPAAASRPTWTTSAPSPPTTRGSSGSAADGLPAHRLQSGIARTALLGPGHRRQLLLADPGLPGGRTGLVAAQVGRGDAFAAPDGVRERRGGGRVVPGRGAGREAAAEHLGVAP